MDLSIIIVSWNVREKLKENLANIFKSKGDFTFEVFVVDNDSHDGTVEMIEKDFPEVKLIKNKDNKGFAKANNQAIKKALGDFILLLNPDMLVFEDTFGNMLAWMLENKQADVAGCHLVDEDNKTIKHVRRFPRFLDQLAIVLKLPHIFPNILKKYLKEDFDYTKASRVDSIRGAFFMIRKKQDMKLLDERYFLWFEEVDYCLATKKNGGEVWYTPKAKCIDYIGKSFGQVPRGLTQKYFRNSMLKYFKKWHPTWQYGILYIAWMISGCLVKLASFFNIKSRAKT